MKCRSLCLGFGLLAMLTACEPSVEELASQANDLFSQEIYEQAAPLYEDILKEEPENPNALSKAAISYFYMRQWDKVIAYGTKAIEKEADFYAVYQLLGLAYEAKEQGEKALAIYQEGSKRFPEREELFEQLGSLAYKLNQPAEAEQAFQHLVQLNPKNLMAHLNIATLKEQSKQYQEAEAILKRVLKDNPQHAGLLFRMASVQENLNHWDAALDYYQQTLLQNPEHLSALYNLAQIQENHRKDKSAALKAWKNYLTVAEKLKGQEKFLAEAKKRIEILGG